MSNDKDEDSISNTSHDHLLGKSDADEDCFGDERQASSLFGGTVRNAATNYYLWHPAPELLGETTVESPAGKKVAVHVDPAEGGGCSGSSPESKSAEADQNSAKAKGDEDEPKQATEAELAEEAAQEAAAAIVKQGGLDHAHRAAIRVLFFSSVTDTTLRDTFDGMLLPPPLAHEEFDDDRYFTREEVVAAAMTIPVELRAVLLRMPMNLALKTGVYDARLRVVMRRLCHLYQVPFTVIEQREEMLVNMDWSDAEAEGNISKKSKVSVGRVLKIGAFTVVGGVALFFTGGLAAPLVAPAFGALVGATATTAAGVGAAGVAMGGTIATVFAGIVGVATQAAALGVLLTPMLSAANVTAIIGTGGAGLGAWKGIKRTAGVGQITFRSLNSIEKLPPIRDELIDKLPKGAMSAEDSSNLDDKHDDALKGVLVPRHVRTIALMNIAKSQKVKDRRRVCPVAIDNDLTHAETLMLKATYLQHGRWVYAPARRIPAGGAGIHMSSNRHNVPTGTGGCCCYMVEGATQHNGYQVWFYYYVSLSGATTVSALVAPSHHRGTPDEFFNALVQTADPISVTFQHNGLMVEAYTRPKPHFLVRKSQSSSMGKNSAFPSRECDQRIEDLKVKLASSRRHIVLLVKNNTVDKTIDVTASKVKTGHIHADTPPAAYIPADHSAIVGLCSNSMSVSGACAYLYLNLTTDVDVEAVAKAEGKDGEKEAEDAPSGETIERRNTVCVGVEISTLKTLLCGVSISDGSTPTRSIKEPKLNKLSAAQSEGDVDKLVDLGRGLRVTWEKVDDAATPTIAVTVCETTEAEEKQTTPKMSLTIGVTGFITSLDHRRKLKDQQVALFQQPFALNNSKLFSASEHVVMQWEDEEQQKFANTISLDVEDTMGSTVGRKAEKYTKTAVAKGVAYQTFVGASVRAFEALSGAVAMPLYAVWGADAIDNCYATLSNRAEGAGEELAAALTSELRGHRPVTLVGYSFGATVIYECLKQLHKIKACGIVENVYLLGGIIPTDRSEWQKIREVVAGRVVNVYNRSDWFLDLVHKSNFSFSSLSGLARVGVAGVENIDASSLVASHADYAKKLDDVLCLIPADPTPESLALDNLGAPGATVPAAERPITSQRLHDNMVGMKPSLLSSTKACVVAVTNRTQLPAILLQYECFGGSFDFYPPGAIPTHSSGACGVVLDTAENTAAGGFVAYGSLLPLAKKPIEADTTDASPTPAATTRSLLVQIVFFGLSKESKYKVRGTSKTLVLDVAIDHNNQEADDDSAGEWYDDASVLEQVQTVLNALVDGLPEVQHIIENDEAFLTRCPLDNAVDYGEEPDEEDMKKYKKEEEKAGKPPSTDSDDASGKDDDATTDPSLSEFHRKLLMLVDEFKWCEKAHEGDDQQQQDDDAKQATKTSTITPRGLSKRLVSRPNDWELVVTSLTELDLPSNVELLAEEGEENGPATDMATEPSVLTVGRVVPVAELMESLKQLQQDQHRSLLQTSSFASFASATFNNTCTGTTDLLNAARGATCRCFPIVIVNGSNEEMAFMEQGDGQIDTKHKGVQWAMFAPPIIPPYSAAIMTLLPASKHNRRSFRALVDEVIRSDGPVCVASCSYACGVGRYHTELFFQKVCEEDPATSTSNTTTTTPAIELSCKCFYVPIDTSDDAPHHTSPTSSLTAFTSMNNGELCHDGEQHDAPGVVAEHKNVDGLRCLLVLLPESKTRQRGGGASEDNSSGKSFVGAKWVMF